MKIAITADVHLTSMERNPERYHALENILQQLVDLEIDHLIIAGDLFDSSCRDPAEFEGLFQTDQYSKIKVHIIPGNHDTILSRGVFIQKNIKYISEPLIIPFTKEAEFLLLPYEESKTVGEVLEERNFDLKLKNWVLVAHGVKIASSRQRNEYEKGMYMPLSGGDIKLYQPKKVFLGHTHSPMDSEIVHYPGSPCGLDVTETGIRSFLTYDTTTGNVVRVPIETDVIFFQIPLTIIPRDDEEQYIREKLLKHITDWNLDEKQLRRVKLRIKVNGYSSDREQALRTILEFLEGSKIYLNENEEPDLSELKLSDDTVRADIVTTVQDRILGLEIIEGPDEPTRDDYILSAMSQIYRG